MKTTRNIVIILALAALVALVPGGGTGANVAVATLRIAFYAAAAWGAQLLYREHRTRLYSLGEKRRAILYVAAGAIAFALIGTSRMWSTSAGSVIWLVLMGGAAYAIFAVIWAARKY